MVCGVDGDRPPVRPRCWHWLVTLGAGACGLAIGGLAGGARDRGDWLTATSTALGVVVAGLGVVELRARYLRRRERARLPGAAPARRRRRAGVVELPAAGRLVGRSREVLLVTEALRTGRVVAVVGRGGVGTSSCAVHAAERLRDTTVSGPWYFDAGGSGRPVRPAAVVAAVAAKLAEPGIVVVDNVTHPSQVQPLLDLVGTGRLLIAGGPALGELLGAIRIHLQEPRPEASAALLAVTLADLDDAAADDAADDGDAGRGETDLVGQRLVELCGRGFDQMRLGFQQAAAITGTTRNAIKSVRGHGLACLDEYIHSMPKLAFAGVSAARGVAQGERWNFYSGP